jgi:site-specific DNA-methyltransferase (adenine-specific)
MKPYYEENGIKIFCRDCMEAMKEMKDKQYNLALVDPPYGVNIGQVVGGGKPFGTKGENRRGKVILPKTYRGFDDSRIPDAEYFKELQRVTANQIIFGGNYFIDHLQSTSCFIVWDKDNSGNFADAELAWTSFKTATRICRHRWNGMLQQDMKNKELRIHPTQKPVRLYEWLLKNYAKPGDKILDTHLGSGSSAIAAYDMGFELTGYEIDKDYFEAATERIKRHMSQGVLPLETPQVHNSTLPLDIKCEIEENEA